MKTLQNMLILLVFTVISLSVNSQTVTVDWTDNCGGNYSGYYEVKLFVLDNVTNVLTQVGELRNLTGEDVTFYSTDIDLDPVGIIRDQNDRYRYVAQVKRQTGICSGQNWTALLDSGEVETGGPFFITVTLN